MAQDVARAPTDAQARDLKRLEFWVRISLCLAFSALFLLVYGGCSQLAAFMPYRVELATSWDSFAFQPAWAWVYVSLNALLLGVAWLLPLQRVLNWFWVLSMQTLWAAPFFLLLPVVPLPRPSSDLAIFVLADTMNLQLNYFPSLHVCYAFTTAWFLGPRLRWLGLMWACAVAWSTLAIREHYLADIAGGLVLAALGIRFLRPCDPEALRGELYCLWNLQHFVRRHRRYGLIGLVLYAASLRDWKGRRPLRVGFAYLQHVDDLLDGHRPCSAEPLDLVDLRGDPDNVDIHVLATLQRVWQRDLLRFPEAQAWVGPLVDCMRRDRQRVLDEAVWSEEQLQKHFRETFGLSLNLMLCLAGHDLRAQEVPEMVDLLAWCSVFRDLDDDLAHGLNNVPVEVTDLRAWKRSEAVRAGQLIQATQTRLESLKGRSGASLLQPFLRSARRIHSGFKN